MWKRRCFLVGASANCLYHTVCHHSSTNRCFRFIGSPLRGNEAGAGGGAVRNYSSFAPSNADAPKNSPLVFCIHGNKFGVAKCCDDLGELLRPGKAADHKIHLKYVFRGHHCLVPEGPARCSGVGRKGARGRTRRRRRAGCCRRRRSRRRRRRGQPSSQPRRRRNVPKRRRGRFSDGFVHR